MLHSNMGAKPMSTDYRRTLGVGETFAIEEIGRELSAKWLRAKAHLIRYFSIN